MRCDATLSPGRIAATALLLTLTACPREPPPASWLQSSGAPRASTETAAAPAVAKPFVSCESLPVNELIRVDQFGYRPAASKVAVLTDPVEGWNANEELRPGRLYEVRSWSDGKLMFSGAPVAWNQGAVQPSSGDRGWWLDFSSLKADGSYCLVDREGGFRSYRFDIGRGVYRDVLRAAFKVYYFQRANVAKQKPYACVGDKCWTSGVDYAGPGQDKEARSVRDRGNPATARDLSGGWWDAGDVNKYINFAQPVVHQLLTAYTDRPAPFGDDFNIPESGNGIPDVLDELKVELDWYRRMQPPDLNGGVLPKLGNVDFGDPVPDKSRLPRYYYPEPCSSATITAAGVFAHAALVMRAVPQLQSYATDLTARAKHAWTHFQQHPRNANCDDGTIKAGDSDKGLPEQEQSAVVSAIYLFALTGGAEYAETIAKSFKSTRPMQEDRWSSYEPEQGDALLFYTTLPSADPTIKSAILERKTSQAASVEIYGMRPELDLYRAYMREDSFHWGHNMIRADVGNTNYDLVQLGVLHGAQATSAIDRAEGLLHSFHGVNPLGIVYLTNMYAYGAEKSANQIYHAWFRDGDPDYDDAQKSRLGPPPGYVPGGPNHQYCAGQDPGQNRCATSRLRQQPIQKSYLDFNTAWDPQNEHDRSWEITEPGIYYQSAYVKLVSKFVE
ncbi:MAG TPA: glycoside hydrolase family 9 protein [Polyangiaceae bacterium]|nr:glycoside hydrolase family 9 protein [Polyangiaceae bacterium]